MKFVQHRFKKDIGVGIDFGTSNTSVAIYDGKKIFMLPIDTYADDKAVMPTSIYVDREFNFTFGTEGINAYIRDNTGRPIRLTKQKLRDIEVTYGESDTFRGRKDEGYDTTVIVEVHAMIDQEMKGILFRHLKKALSIRGRELIPIFNKKFTVGALITIFLANLKKTIESHLEMPIESMHIGRPVHYSENEEGDKTAIEQMNQACLNAGFENITFLYEPLGASLSFAKGKYPIGKKILVFDFGGGTLDISITETGKKQGRVLSVAGVPVGGSLLDRIIYVQKVLPLLGKGIYIKEGDKEFRFPFIRYEEDLLNWQQTYLLNTPDKIEPILRDIKTLEKHNKQNAEKLMRLYTVISENYSYLVYKHIEEAKCQLSDKTKALIKMDSLFLKEHLSRKEFNHYIAEELKKVKDCLKNALSLAQVKPSGIDVAIRTGGSSRIKIVQDFLEKQFPCKVLEYDVYTGVAAGLAVGNYYAKKRRNKEVKA